MAPSSPSLPTFLISFSACPFMILLFTQIPKFQVPIISCNNYCNSFSLALANITFLISNQSAAALAVSLFSSTGFPFLNHIKQKFLVIPIKALYFPSTCSPSLLTAPWKSDFGIHLPCSANSLHLLQIHTWEDFVSHLQTPASFSLPPKAPFCSDALQNLAGVSFCFTLYLPC